MPSGPKAWAFAVQEIFVPNDICPSPRRSKNGLYLITSTCTTKIYWEIGKIGLTIER